ncbi:MAG TPA: hypothetical protein VKP78_07575 [bacterium]|nr:hypothetical protein [bacterium]
MYDKEFKEQAVDLYFSTAQSLVELAVDLGGPQSTPGNWCKKSKTYPDNPFPGRGKLRLEDTKQKEIINENIRLRRERDIFKKFLNLNFQFSIKVYNSLWALFMIILAIDTWLCKS